MSRNDARNQYAARQFVREFSSVSAYRSLPGPRSAIASRDSRKRSNGALPWQNTWHLAPQLLHFCGFWLALLRNGKRGDRGRESEREREIESRVGPPPRHRAALPTGRVWFSPGAPSAMHRRLETSLTNHIYIWKVRQLPRLRFTSSTLYESPRRRPHWTIHPSALPLPALNYFHLIVPRSYELFSPPIPLCCFRQHFEYRHGALAFTIRRRNSFGR